MDFVATLDVKERYVQRCTRCERHVLLSVTGLIAAEAVERNHQEADERQDVADIDAGQTEEQALGQSLFGRQDFLSPKQ